jgi:peptidoglycan/xylan/chitin deacetylase (PgdA/CDA1 family)
MSVFLMYHEVGEDAGCEHRYVVSPSAFAEQLAHLRKNGYEVADVGRALAHANPVRRRVVLTFDDGAASDRLVAAPLLLEQGFGATFYVVPNFLGRPGFMTEAQVVELAQMGFEIGSHSMNHRYLTDLDDADLHEEVAGSKARLEEILGAPIAHFACPGGRVSGRVEQAVKEAGYRSLATSHVGRNGARTDPFRLTRVAMYRHTSLPHFARLCRGQGLLARQLPETLLGAAKTLLGNSAFDRARSLVLSVANGWTSARPPASRAT